MEIVQQDAVTVAAECGQPAAGLASVSVVIVNHNAGRLLGDCLEAALAQAAEIVLVDNASDPAVFEATIRRFDGHPRLVVLRSAVNTGFAAGCNLGGERCTQPAILFLNPDCILGPRSLAAMLRALFADPAVGMVGGLLTDELGIEQGGARRSVPTPWRSFVRGFGLGRLARRWPKLFSDFCLHRDPLPSAPLDVEAVSGACLLVKRNVVKEVGPWDEGFFLHCEDLDWCMRFHRAGWRIQFVPDAPAVHHRGMCGRTRPLFVEWHKHKGMVRFYRKHFRHQYPLGLMALVIAGVWLRFAAIAARQATLYLFSSLAQLPALVRRPRLPVRPLVPLNRRRVVSPGSVPS
jgi:GT2 family glycosyltransferase